MAAIHGAKATVTILILLLAITSKLSNSQDIEATSEDFREGYTATELGSTATTESNPDGSNVVSEKPGVRDIHVVGLFPLSGEGEEKSLGKGVLPAVKLALEHVRQSKDVLNGYNLQTTLNDTMVRLTIYLVSIFILKQTIHFFPFIYTIRTLSVLNLNV